MSQIIFNEDLNHFVYTRAMHDIDVTEKEIYSFIDQYKGTQITDFMINVSASQAWYPSKRGQNIPDMYEALLKSGKISKDDTNPLAKCMKTLHNIYRVKGLDMYGMWIERLRKIGINPWISVRMNDIHDYSNKDHITHTDFFRNSKGIRRGDHRPSGNLYDNAFDFMRDDVRHEIMEMIIDALSTFDMYGLELDWMREIYCIRIGREWEGMAVINAFMNDVYAEVKKAEKHWGHHIKIGVRLPATVEKSLRLGFDFFNWVQNGWIDLITVTPRWSSSDNNMPVDIWARILKGSKVTLAAGLEILIDSYNRPGRKYMFNSFETAIGSAAGYLSMGADAIYLFNYMDGVNGQYFNSDLPLCTDEDLYRKFLCSVGTGSTCYDLPRRHLITFNDVFAPGIDDVYALPLKALHNDADTKTEYKFLRIPTGKINMNFKVRFIIGIEKDHPMNDDLLVYANAVKLTLIGPTVLPIPCWSTLDYYEYLIPNDGTLPVVTVFEIGSKKGDFIIHWAEIRLLY